MRQQISTTRWLNYGPCHEAEPSVVRIRMQGLKGEPLAAILQRVLTVASTELEAGAVVSVTTDRIRVRRLPIGA